VILLHWIVGFGVVNLERFRFGSLADVIQRLILLSAHALALVAAQVDLFRPVKRNGARFNLKRRSSSSLRFMLGYEHARRSKGSRGLKGPPRTETMSWVRGAWN